MKLPLRWLLCVLALYTVMMCTFCKKTPTEADEEEFALEEITDVLPNPFKGFVPWIGVGTPIYQEKLQYATFAWRDLEPEKGVFNWRHLEQNWGNVANTGKLVGFRVAAEIPGSGQNDIPQWLIDEGVSMRPYSIDGHDGLAPDWDDPKFLAAHHDFILTLGARYDSDDRIAWIDVGSYGFWGEWHVWLNDSLAATQATKQAILEDYFEAFPTKPKVIAFDDDFATKYATDRGGGIRNDCLGTQDANDWYLESLNGIDPILNDNVWKTAIITGEFCGGAQGAIDGTTIRFNMNYEFIKETHWSFIGPAGGAIFPQSDEHRENLDKLHKTLGYRFVLRKVEHIDSIQRGEELFVQIQVENKGVAPFYFEWPMVFYLITSEDSVAFQTDTGVDIRNWLPGTHMETVAIHIPEEIDAREYDVKLAIHDPQDGEPGILFANSRKDDKDRYLVSYLNVQ